MKKVGDKVRIVATGLHSFKGDTGRVIKVREGYLLKYLVRVRGMKIWVGESEIVKVKEDVE